MLELHSYHIELSILHKYGLYCLYFELYSDCFGHLLDSHMQYLTL